MKSHSLTLSCAGLALVLAAAAAQAAGLPAERQAGSVSYVTGGVSDEEANAFKQMSHSYPLSIELVQKQVGRNEFTADAHVRVIDHSGAAVLDAKADGPFMLVRVPPGEYRVQATLNGRTVESGPVKVGANGSAQATLAFPTKTD
jgi:hypothetical protein